MPRTEIQSSISSISSIISSHVARVHRYARPLSWIFSCLFVSHFLVNTFPHSEQGNGFSPLCALIWSSRIFLLVKDLEQIGHLYFVGGTSGLCIFAKLSPRSRSAGWYLFSWVARSLFERNPCVNRSQFSSLHRNGRSCWLSWSCRWALAGKPSWKLEHITLGQRNGRSSYSETKSNLVSSLSFSSRSRLRVRVSFNVGMLTLFLAFRSPCCAV